MNTQMLEEVRMNLNALVEVKGAVLYDGDILEISKKLDSLIYDYMIAQL